MREQLRTAKPPACRKTRRCSRACRRASQRILVPTANGDLVLDADEIDWIARMIITRPFMRVRTAFVARVTGLLEPAGSHRFVRTHRSAIEHRSR